ncbi:MAG: very-long-chain enoyl-CoA reductase [Streblomastix strix]|uniref:Very-long-chain enoyl-CoA reductase n=1 Tax=Streblomastix strix TaxID=222440 RepID=A0A5J4W665_9EUKA|nr:MAG: very-long-chain enoyl-CoA reductase [Streblomastix strix]
MSIENRIVKAEYKKQSIDIDPEEMQTVEKVLDHLSLTLKLKKLRIRLLHKLEGKKPIPLTNEQFTPTDGKLIVKDLGPQVGYRFVFVVEYLGPLSIFPIVYLLRGIIYNFYNPGIIVGTLKHAQIIAISLWTLHYLKRIIESIFVHSFSHDTMPLSNLAKNSGYYWIFAFLIAYVIGHPLYTQPDQVWIYIGIAVFAVFEVLNLLSHIHLASLRKRSGQKDHPVPTAWMFRLTVCPNYTFEILSWLGFNLATHTLIGIVFMFAGAVQMYQWALKKRKRYIHEHPEYPKHRKLIFPLLL